jgi:hypothetical protein
MNAIPLGRYRILRANVNPPDEGDIVNLDQGFTSPDGEPMVIVYCLGADGSMLYEAEVYEFELTPK